MIAEISTARFGSTAQFGDEGGLVLANRLAEAVKRRWRQGEPPDVGGVLASHPELGHYRSVVLDLAYSEYRARLHAGEPIDAQTFARQFPSLERSLYLLIEVHGLLSHDPDLQLLQESVSWPEAGSRFLQFDLTAEIGRGAFGRVFLATEPALGQRQVVVKVAPQAGGEAEIIGRLRHPNIVPIYSLQEDQATGLAAFCMPYLGRATLCDVLDQSFRAGRPPQRANTILAAIGMVNRDLDAREAPSPAGILRRGSFVDGVVYLAAQLADALVHSHGRGIYHRDLKPSNVLMTPEGRPLLLDFNLSIDSRLPAWKVGGTLPYMAPEELSHLTGRPVESHAARYDPRSDVFSLGVIVYELLTGKLPFGTIPRDCPIEEAARRLREQQTQGPRPIRQFNGQADRRLARLVESCLAFEPERRPETAQQLAAALRRELSLARRGRRWMGNHRGLVLGASTALFAVALATALFFAMRPSYGARQLQLGLQRMKEGNYAAAIEDLNDSIRAGQKTANAYFARASACQRQGDFLMAERDYDVVRKLGHNPLASACSAYCLCRFKMPSAAIHFCQLALKEGYNRPAVLYNNMAYCYFSLERLKDAETCLQQALQIDDTLQAVHCNMVVLALKRATDKTPIPLAALLHAAKAIEIGPPSVEVFRSVSALYAIAARTDPSLAQPAIENVAKAVEAGCSPDSIVKEASYSAIWKEPAFLAALSKRGSPSPSAKPATLIDPLDQ